MSVACLIWFLCLRFLYNISTVVEVVNVLNWSTKVKKISIINMHNIIHYQVLHTLSFTLYECLCIYIYICSYSSKASLYSYLYSWEICHFDLVLFTSVIRTSSINQVGKNSCPSLKFSSKAFSFSVSTLHSYAHNDYKQPAEKHTPVETPLVDRDCLNV